MNINFLHYGDGLKRINNAIADIHCSIVTKNIFIDTLNKNNYSNSFTDDIINHFFQYRRKVGIKSIRKLISKSLYYHSLFKKLGHRGFSYEIHHDFNFNYSLSNNINFKLSLIANPKLYYPPPVRKRLTTLHYGHVFNDMCPAICFSLGSICNYNNKKCLFIFVLQSDIIFKSESYIREHFRGWRKALFYNILQFAHKNNIDSLYLIRSKDIIKCCHPGFSKPSSIPKLWKSIYDNTANAFNLKPTKLNSYINAQIFKGKNKILINSFYNLNIIRS